MTNEKFFKEHQTLPRTTTTYMKLDIDGGVIEYWVSDDNGDWRDMTEVKRAQMEMQKAREKLLKLIKED